MKKIALFLFFALSTDLTYSQGNKETIDATVKLVNTNPNFIGGMLPFFDLNLLPNSRSVGSTIGAYCKINKIVASVKYQLNWGSGLENAEKQEYERLGKSIYEYQIPKNLFLNFGYILGTKEKTTNVSFLLSRGRAATSKISGQTASKYAKMKLPGTKFYMVNLGFQKGFNTMICDNKDMRIEGVDVPDGYEIPTPSKISTVMDYSYLSLGLSMGTFGFWKADIEGYGERTSSKYVRYYANVIILIGSSIDPIYYLNVKEQSHPTYNDKIYSKYNLNNSPRTKSGIMFGVENSNAHGFGFSEGIEFGFLPGIKGTKFGSNFALLINVDISLAKILN